ncbi:hypothetical protein [Leptospira interrogans]|uniref:hypothetical protein n=1 Tax=Leptospira interrogans TaxID=173 RepID=UPI0007739ED5|nr:hypothetical protein [Leptospira interrogans]
MSNEILNIGRRIQGFWDHVKPRLGYDSEIWIGEVVLYTDLKNIVLNNEFKTECDLSRYGIRIELTEKEFILGLNYDKFWTAVQFSSYESEVLDYLNDALSTLGIFVLNWTSFSKKRLTFNNKVELKPNELLFFHELLDRMVYKNMIIYKENATYTFEKNEFVLEFKFNIDENSSIVHVKTSTDNLSYMAEELNPRNEFYYIALEEARSILNSQMTKFFDEAQTLQVDPVWIRVLELIVNSQLSVNSASKVNGVKNQISLVQNLGHLGLDNIYENLFGISLDTIFGKLGAWLKETESTKDELRFAFRFLKWSERMFQNIRTKFQISKTQETGMPLDEYDLDVQYFEGQRNE